AKSRFQKRLLVVFIVMTIISSLLGVFAIRSRNAARAARDQFVAERDRAQLAENDAKREQLKRELQGYGWQKEQLSNVDGNQGSVQKSEEANGKIQQIYDPKSVP